MSVTKIKGENLRLKLSNKVIACATSCTVHVSAALEDSSTKDSPAGSWTEQEVTNKSWDLSTDALVIIDATDTSSIKGLDALALVGETVEVVFGQSSGTGNREITASYSGKAIVNDVSLSAPNGQKATYTLQATGVGALSTGSQVAGDQ